MSGIPIFLNIRQYPRHYVCRLSPASTRSSPVISRHRLTGFSFRIKRGSRRLSVGYPSTNSTTSFSCSNRAEFLIITSNFRESKCTTICCDRPAHNIRRSPSIVSRQVNVCSFAIPFHSRHCAITVSATLFHTAGPSFSATSRFSVSSCLCPSAESFPAKYSCAARFALSSRITLVSKNILHNLQRSTSHQISTVPTIVLPRKTRCQETILRSAAKLKSRGSQKSGTCAVHAVVRGAWVACLLLLFEAQWRSTDLFRIQ